MKTLPVEKTQTDSPKHHNKQSLAQGQVMHNNQKGLKRSEETSPVLVVQEKNTNTAMVDEDLLLTGAIIMRCTGPTLAEILCMNR